MKTKYPYTYALEKLPKLLNHIRDSAIPNQMSVSYLQKAGFTSSHDRSLIPVLKFIRLVDQGGTPTDQYHYYRDDSTRDLVLGGLVQQSYAALYEMYPDAHNHEEAALRNFFRTDAKVSEEVATRMCSTFRALCMMARFDADSRKARPPKASSDGDFGLNGEEGLQRRVSSVQVCVNVQVVIPDTADASMIDNIFKSIAKHLGISE